MTPTDPFFTLDTERGVLRISIAVTLCIAGIGVAFGLVSGSFSIMFDGVYSLVDASMSALSLVVVQLIHSHATSTTLSRKLRERFTMGFWHLEPMVLALNGILLTGVSLYALVNAVSSLLQGGRELEFGWAVVYALLTVVACSTIALAEAKANRRIRSDFLAMDVKGWIMSASITAALLGAFCLGYAVQGTRWQWISPYIDPAVLALVCVVIIPLPLGAIRQALAEVFLVTPTDLRQHVDAVAKAIVRRHGLRTYRAYVAKVGRSRIVELYFIVPADAPPRTIAEWDALRDEVSELIGSDTPDRWLTVVFTGDLEWAE